jgi:hypothetical protein
MCLRSANRRQRTFKLFFFLDGREKLSELQTDFAEKCGKDFNLQRGIEGSKAKHTTIKEYYTRIQSEIPQINTRVPELNPPTKAQTLMQAIGIETEYTKQKKIRDELQEKQNQEKIEKQKSIEAKAKKYDLEASKNRHREEQITKMRETSIQLRQIPLESVLRRLQIEQDKNDKKNWKTPAGRMTITENKFYSHDLGKGGVGAIDLVMIIEQTEYKTAINWLSKEFGISVVLSESITNLKPKIEEISKETQIFKIPKEIKENWSHVKNYLTEKRKLSESIVNELYKEKKIYAD